MKKKVLPDMSTISTEKDHRNKPVPGSPVARKTRKHSGEIAETIPVSKDGTAPHRDNENSKRARQALKRNAEGRPTDLETNEQLRREIVQREQAEETLQERLGFEALLADLSARFIVVSPEEIDREIEQALKQILEFFQADRCGLLRILKDSAKLTHIVLREGIPLPANMDLSTNRFPWVLQKDSRAPRGGGL